MNDHSSFILSDYFLAEASRLTSSTDLIRSKMLACYKALVAAQDRLLNANDRTDLYQKIALYKYEIAMADIEVRILREHATSLRAAAYH